MFLLADKIVSLRQRGWLTGLEAWRQAPDAPAPPVGARRGRPPRRRGRPIRGTRATVIRQADSYPPRRRDIAAAFSAPSRLTARLLSARQATSNLAKPLFPPAIDPGAAPRAARPQHDPLIPAPSSPESAAAPAGDKPIEPTGEPPEHVAESASPSRPQGDARTDEPRAQSAPPDPTDLTLLARREIAESPVSRPSATARQADGQRAPMVGSQRAAPASINLAGLLRAARSGIEGRLAAREASAAGDERAASMIHGSLPGAAEDLAAPGDARVRRAAGSAGAGFTALDALDPSALVGPLSQALAGRDRPDDWRQAEILQRLKNIDENTRRPASAAPSAFV